MNKCNHLKYEKSTGMLRISANNMSDYILVDFALAMKFKFCPVCGKRITTKGGKQ